MFNPPFALEHYVSSALIVQEKGKRNKYLVSATIPNVVLVLFHAAFFCAAVVLAAGVLALAVVAGERAVVCVSYGAEKRRKRWKGRELTRQREGRGERGWWRNAW